MNPIGEPSNCAANGSIQTHRTFSAVRVEKICSARLVVLLEVLFVFAFTGEAFLFPFGLLAEAPDLGTAKTSGTDELPPPCFFARYPKSLLLEDLFNDGKAASAIHN